jgi:uncharacterized protein (TIGR03437 family)
MGHRNPAKWGSLRPFGLFFALCFCALSGFGQTPRIDWRRIGNSSLIKGLPSPAGGPVERVWFDGEGTRLYAQSAPGKTFSTEDFEAWTVAQAAPPAVEDGVQAARRPEPGAKLRALRRRSATLYSFGANAWRSEDEGATWANLTAWKGTSLLGAPVTDMAVSPQNERQVAVATRTGVWMSIDGGLSWQGLNDGLPNLPVRRILATPSGSRGTRIMTGGSDQEIGEVYEWSPGQKQGWAVTGDEEAVATVSERAYYSARLGVTLSAVATSGDSVFAGSTDGRLWSSSDRGQTWLAFSGGSGRVERIWTSTADPRLALAAVSAGSSPDQPARLFRTMNTGAGWDDLTTNLPNTALYSVVADRSSGAIYVASARGVFFTVTDLKAPVSGTPWTLISDALPQAVARDVKLDAAANQLFVGLDGYGIYAAMAPHRRAAPALVHAADYGVRAAAPGALLSVLGVSVQGASAGQIKAPVLATSEAESQIQVPFEASGDQLTLTVGSRAGTFRLGLPLESVSPAILIDRDGAPMLLDGDSGIQMDAASPAHASVRVQIFASGLGKVTPNWPSGVAAPLEAAPRVVTPVRAYLDGSPVPVTRATLAPGYIGYYLVEVQLPDIVNVGASELWIEAGGRSSNRVRIYVDR